MAAAKSTRKSAPFPAWVTWLLVVALAGFGIGAVALGAIGYPFELPSRRDRGPRADSFWSSMDSGDPIWFADHIVWFAIAGFLAYLAVSLVSLWISPRSKAIQRLMLATLGATAVVSLGVLVTMVTLWVAGVPASSSTLYTSGLPYLAPTLVSIALVLFTGGLTVVGVRLNRSRRR